MRLAAILYQATAGVIFIQLLLGGLLVLGFITGDAHIITGIIVGVLALASMIVVLVSKPKYSALRLSSIVLFVLVAVQGVLGFSAFNSDQIVFIHFTNALLVFGVSIAGVFYAVRWNRMPVPTAEKQRQSQPEQLGKPS